MVEVLMKQFGDLTVTDVEDVDGYLEKTYTPKVAVTTKIMELLRFCKQEHESIPIFHASCIAKVKSFEAICSSRNVVEVCLQIAGCYSSDRLREKALAYLEEKLTDKATVVISEFTEKMEFHASLLTEESVNVVKSVYKKKRRKKKKAKSVNAISSNTDSVIVSVNSAEVDYVNKDLRYCTIRVASSFIRFKIDTGADICLLSIHSYNSLKNKPKMSQTLIQARNCNGRIFQLLGYFEEVIFDHTVKIYVADVLSNLLGGISAYRAVASKLKRIKDISHVGAEISEESLRHELMKKFPVLTGVKSSSLGISGFVADSELLPGITPKYIPARKIPLGFENIVNNLWMSGLNLALLNHWVI
uniref:Peptidase A2 domain-containing protein n=1 Tax=Strongyloides venezuelensis TaxID=75913 RepID=A0A0K0FB28_STRVS